MATIPDLKITNTPAHNYHKSTLLWNTMQCETPVEVLDHGSCYRIESKSGCILCNVDSLGGRWWDQWVSSTRVRSVEEYGAIERCVGDIGRWRDSSTRIQWVPPLCHQFHHNRHHHQYIHYHWQSCMSLATVRCSIPHTTQRNPPIPTVAPRSYIHWKSCFVWF